MKKKLLAVALCICAAFSVVACGGQETSEEGTTDETNSETKTEAKITLGDYKGIKVDASLGEVSEEDLKEYLDSVLESKATTEEITEGVLAKDDEIKFDCTIYVDGEEYKAVTGESMELNVAAGTVSAGFPEGDLCAGIIGKNIGEEIELNLKYGDDYTDTKVAGKEAVFKVKVTAKLNTIVPEFTDEFVATNFDYLNLSTKDDLLNYLKKDIVINQVYADIWEKVVFETATVDSYDSDDLAAMTTEYAEYQEYYIYQMTGSTLADYLTATEQTEEDFYAQMEEIAKTYLKQEMVVNAIAEAENIVITDEAYASEMLEFAKSYGYDTVEEFETAYADSMTKEDFEFTILTYLVEEFVCTNVEYVEGLGLYTEKATESQSSTEDTTEDSSQETTSSAE